jgi:hypothetical protein
MAGETDVKTEPVQALTAPATIPDPGPVRPIAPEVIALLERGRAIQENMILIRACVSQMTDSLIAAYPGYKKQIADVLEGEAQKLLKLHHGEQQEARRNGSR